MNRTIYTYSVGGSDGLWFVLRSAKGMEAHHILWYDTEEHARGAAAALNALAEYGR